MGALHLVLAMTVPVVVGLALLAGWLFRRVRDAQDTAARRQRVLETLGSVAGKVAACQEEPSRTVLTGLDDLGFDAAAIAVFDEPSGRWLGRDADGRRVSSERWVARAAQQAWDGQRTVTTPSDAAEGEWVVASPVLSGTGVTTVLVARGSGRPVEPDDAAAVEASAGVLGSARPTLEGSLVGRGPAGPRRPGPVDNLTGLGTATSFHAAVERRCLDKETPIAVLLVAVDGVETVSDELGERSGEEAVRIAARRLRRCVRPEDDLARLDPTVFGVLLAQADDPAGAATVGSRVVAALESPVSVTGGDVRVSCRAGLVWDASGDAEPLTLLPEARQALSRADGDVATSIRLGESIPVDRPGRR